MKCDFCWKEFENLKEFKDGVEIYKFCKKCIEMFERESKYEGREDNYAP